MFHCLHCLLYLALFKSNMKHLRPVNHPQTNLHLKLLISSIGSFWFLERLFSFEKLIHEDQWQHLWSPRSEHAWRTPTYQGGCRLVKTLLILILQLDYSTLPNWEDSNFPLDSPCAWLCVFVFSYDCAPKFPLSVKRRKGQIAQDSSHACVSVTDSQWGPFYETSAVFFKSRVLSNVNVCKNSNTHKMVNAAQKNNSEHTGQ